MKEKLKVWSKKWWFWVIVVVLVLGIIGSLGDNSKNPSKTSNNTTTTKYTLVGKTTGEYGKEVILNKDTDLPVTKYLYKIPAGTYKVTTTYDKLSEFWIVKDEIVRTGTDEYPEELSYVGEAHDLTNGDNDFNGRASKELTITIAEDESVLINGTETLIFETK